jgi:hypothetical protein
VTTLASGIRKEELGGTSSWRRLHEVLLSGVGFEEITRDPAKYLGEEARALQPRPPN